MAQKNYIKDIKNSMLLQIVEKSFQTEIGRVEITRSDDRVVVECFTNNNRLGQVAKVTFSNFDAVCESGVGFPHSKELVMIRFLNVMERVHGDDYKRDWAKFQRDNFEKEESQPLNN